MVLKSESNPPVIELVLGAQFSPLTKMSTGHLGLFWQHLGEAWANFSDAPPLDDQFETFEIPRWLKHGGVGLSFAPVRTPGRAMIHHRDEERLIQLQPSRFHLNWRKKDGIYPRYRTLIDEFEADFQQFSDFASGKGIGDVAVNQWEMTYVDAFVQGVDWESPGDWASLLPGLFGKPIASEGIMLEERAAQWTYEILPKRGRLHIVASAGKVPESDKSALILQMTARGPVGANGAACLREGLDLGHEFSGRVFRSVISEAIKTRLDAAND